VALTKGDPRQDGPALVRMHKVSFADDVLNVLGGRSGLVDEGVQTLAEHDGPGVMVFIRETNASAITERFGAAPADPPGAREERLLREYGVGAQILLDLGVRKMILLSTAPQTIVGLDGYGLEIVEQREIEGGRHGR